MPGAPSPVSWVPAFMAAMGAYILNPNVGGMYGMWDSPTPGLHSNGTVTPGEGGVDLDAPIGTPVYAIAPGSIVGAGYWNDDAHGVVTTRVNVPGLGPQDLYYQHITLDPSISDCTGGTCSQSVVTGQKIGTVGPYAETEMGFNAQWGGIWGESHPGPWVADPRPWLVSLLSGVPSNFDPGGAVNTGGVGSGGTVVGTNNLPSFGIKIGLFVFAFVLLGLGVWLLFKQQIKAGANKVKNVALAVGTGGTDVQADKGAL